MDWTASKLQSRNRTSSPPDEDGRAWWVGKSIELLDAHWAELAGAGAERKEKLASQPLAQRQYSIPIRASYVIECQFCPDYPPKGGSV